MSGPKVALENTEQDQAVSENEWASKSSKRNSMLNECKAAFEFGDESEAE